MEKQRGGSGKKRKGYGKKEGGAEIGKECRKEKEIYMERERLKKRKK